MVTVNYMLRFCVFITILLGVPFSSVFSQEESTHLKKIVAELAQQYEEGDIGSTIFAEGQELAYEEILIVKDDTLASIAAEHGISVQVLLEINDLSSTNIQIGNVLKIPSVTSSVTSSVASSAKGDFQVQTPIINIEGSKVDQKLEPKTTKTIDTKTIDTKTIDTKTIDEGSDQLDSQQAQMSQNISTNYELEGRLVERLQDDREYVIVQPGDTLTRIAKDYSIGIQDLMTFNNLSSTHLNVGRVIYINAPPPPPEELHTITVQIGDTLSDLAARYGITPQALMRANGLATPFIRTGQVLILPNDALPTPLEEVETSQSYIVEQGDALYRIALKFGIPQERLIALNNLEGSNIYVGQELKIVGNGEELKPLKVLIKQGDTLANIARKYDIDLRELASANKLGLKDVLHINKELIIPERYVATAGSQSDQGASEIRYVTVKRSDTLWGLAKKHATTVDAIVAENRLSSYAINEGQELRIIPGLDLPPAAHSPAAYSRVKEDQLAKLALATEAVASLEHGLEKQSPKLIWPLKGSITSHFGYRHLTIGGKSYNIHTGIDIDGDSGDLIVAATAGKVIFSGWRAGYGKLVIIESEPYHYYYAHASKLMVAVGEYVDQGQAIAKVGATGVTTGTHLHFEIRIKDKPENPLDHLN